MRNAPARFLFTVNVIKLKKRPEPLVLVCLSSAFYIGYIIWLNIRVLMILPGSATRWFPLLLTNLILLGLIGFVFARIVPPYLIVYTDEGIKWPSVTGYKFMRWSEVISVEEEMAQGKGRKIIFISARHKIVINPQLFLAVDEAVSKLKKQVPADVWK